MKNIDEINSMLLEECCLKCLELYNSLFGQDFEYEELFFLGGLDALNPSDEGKVNELRDISFELQRCSIIEDENEEDKIEKKGVLEELKIKLEGFSL